MLNNILTLGIDTSDLCSEIIFFNNKKITAQLMIDLKQNHAETLIRKIDFLLKESNLKLEDFNFLLGILGPGSFTGLRIGLTLVKTLAYSLKLPLLGISTLELMALKTSRDLKLSDKRIIAFKKGIRDEFFMGRYESDSQRVLKKIEERLILAGEIKENLFNEADYMVLDQNCDDPDVFSSFKNKKIYYRRPSLNCLADFDGLFDQYRIELENFEPIYLRLSEAELKYKDQKNRKYHLYIEKLLS